MFREKLRRVRVVPEERFERSRCLRGSLVLVRPDPVPRCFLRCKVLGGSPGSPERSTLGPPLRP